jgi:hypothetical protein
VGGKGKAISRVASAEPGRIYSGYIRIRVNFVKQKILPLVRNPLKRASEARGPYSIGSHAREKVAPRSIGAAFPPRRGFGGVAKMFAERCFGPGQRKFGLPCLRCGQNPHLWKSRRAGPRALRYLLLRFLSERSKCSADLF